MKKTSNKRPTTIAQYIDAAPSVGQAHLRKLYTILESVAPEAEQVIKWNTPFFIEPRFLFSFSGHKAHCNFAPSEETLEVFRVDLDSHATTKNFLQLPYDQPIPETLIRMIAEYRLKLVTERTDDGFW